MKQYSHSLKKALLDSFPEFRGLVFPCRFIPTHEVPLDEKVDAVTERVRYTKGHWQDINNCRIFLEEIAKEQGFDPLDLRSWDSLGTTQIIKRVCVSFSSPPLPIPLYSLHELITFRVGERCCIIKVGSRKSSRNPFQKQIFPFGV